MTSALPDHVRTILFNRVPEVTLAFWVMTGLLVVVLIIVIVRFAFTANVVFCFWVDYVLTRPWVLPWATYLGIAVGRQRRAMQSPQSLVLAD